jgi:hypothetical protein
MVKITDFGLAVPQTDAQNVSNLAWVKGSVDYCSPEQRFGLPQDQRSDVFSLAVLSYELLTGRVPGRYYVSAVQRNPHLPAELDEVLRRGLARDASERFGSVEEFRRALNFVLNPPSRNWVLKSCLAATVLLILGISWGFLKYSSTYHINFETAAEEPAPDRAWYVSETSNDASPLEGRNEGPPNTIAGTPVTQLCLQSLPPGKKLDRLVPEWPYPLPCVVLNGPERWCFFHLHESARQVFGTNEFAFWSKIFEIPPLTGQENFVRAGRFEGDCLGGDSATWRKAVTRTEKNIPPIISLGFPPDRPQNQALCLTKTPSNSDQEMVCYQWLAREPRRHGTFMILRYRARAEIGEPSVAIGVVYPLKIPKADSSPLAYWLRSHLKATEGDSPPDADVGDFWINDWVTVTDQYQTYCVVWQWPPYCSRSDRNLLIHFGGEGKIWIENVELFTWDREVTR